MAMSIGELQALQRLMTSTEETAGVLNDDEERAGYYNYESQMSDMAEAEPTRTVIKSLFGALHGGNWVYEKVAGVVRKYMHQASTFVGAFTKTGTTVSKVDTKNTVGTRNVEEVFNGYPVVTNTNGGLSSSTSYSGNITNFNMPGRVYVRGIPNIVRDEDWLYNDWTKATKTDIANTEITHTPPVVTGVVGRSGSVNGIVNLSSGSAQYVSKIIQSTVNPNARFESCKLKFAIDNPDSALMYVDIYQIVCSDPDGIWFPGDHPGYRGDMTVAAQNLVYSRELSTLKYSDQDHQIAFILPQLPSRHACSFLLVQVRPEPSWSGITVSNNPRLVIPYSIVANVNPEMFGDFELNRSALDGTDELI